jgi:hypothetical protein
MNTDRSEKTIKEIFVGKCWQYLHDNFHKFNQTNQIKIALELCKKNIPQEVEGIGGTTVNVDNQRRVFIFKDAIPDDENDSDRPLYAEEGAEGTRLE